jgi:hypothetical protein
MIIKSSLALDSFDNISCIVVAFNLKDLIIDSINIVKGIASKSSVTNMAAFTKNTSVFSEAQTKVSKLNQRYAIEQEEASTMCS